MKRIFTLSLILLLLSGLAFAGTDDRSPQVESADSTLTEEQVEDFVGTMLGGTETGVTVDYDDAGNAINFVVDPTNDRYDVTVYGAVGDGVADDRSAINDAHTAATASGGNIVFPTGTYKISSNLTLDPDTVLVFEPGATLSVDGGVTVTINAGIADTNRQIFATTGTIAGSPRVDFVRPEWWGAVGDDSTICTTAIDTAIKFASDNGTGVVRFLPEATYIVDSALEYTATYDSVTLQGGSKNTVITFNHDLITGTDNSGVDDKGTSVVDTTTNFVTEGVVIGGYLWNTTDGSNGLITGISTTTNPNDTLSVASFADGTDDDFDNGDTYVVTNPGISLRGTSSPLDGVSGWTVQDISFDASYTNNNDRPPLCFYMSYAVNVIFDNVGIGGSGTSFRVAGIQMGSSWKHRYEKVTISTCATGVKGVGWLLTFEDCDFVAGYYGFDLAGYNVKISNCNLEGNSVNGIRNRGVSYNWLVENCYFESVGDPAIYFSQVHYSTIIGHYSISNLVLAYSDHNVVVNWRGNIDVGGTSNDNVITHCTGTVTDGSAVGNTRVLDDAVPLYEGLQITGKSKASDTLVIDGGNVGVGNFGPDTPASKLDVIDDTNPQLQLSYGSVDDYTDMDGTYWAEAVDGTVHDITTEDVSLSMWINVAADGGFTKMWSKGGRLEFYVLSDGTLIFRAEDGDADVFYVEGNTDLRDTTWHHVAMIFDRDEDTYSQVYVDGVGDKEKDTFTASDIGTLTTADELALGSGNNGASIFKGKIADVRLYIAADAHWSQEEIQYQYLNPRCAADANAGSVTEYWAVDEGSGVTIAGSDGNDLTLTNALAWDSNSVKTTFQTDASGFLSIVPSGGAAEVTLGADAGDDFTVDTDKLVVEGDTGNVGIGLTTPIYRLDLQSADHQSLRLYNPTAVVGSKNWLDFSLNDGGGVITNYGTLKAVIVNNTDSIEAGELEFYTMQAGTLTEQMTIDDNGNVGINTTGPDRKLDVLDAANPQVRLTHTDGTVYTDFQTDANGDLTVTPSGGDVDIAGNLEVNAGNITGETKHLRFNLADPNSLQGLDTEWCVWPVVDAAITISKITVTLDAAGNEVTGDLKYADTFIGLANPIVINDFDTTSGVRVDSSISSGAVAATKAIYVSWDAAPNAAITQAVFDVEYSYD